ncbi:FAD:protein FMN transferase [Saliterribacillus persicus]|uniref:FAD:protein FMN transferase n=1 Tax=Saliterribacillus persicus TaxID=930114 RepID=A0A368XXY5_9BACI|nr:FAD:protein FMN transferase [Saliterribacillus persicus]RCW71898.1 thiamine biosynthesis lipoprotein [Saliterribacillus persicus]
MKKILAIILFSSIIIVGCNGTTGEEEVSTQPFKQTEFLLGTVVTVKIYDEDKEAVLQEAFTLMEELEAKISTSIEDSEINKINQQAGKEAVKVSEEVFNLIESGKAYSEKANGSFDITIGPLTSLWHIGYEDAKKPDQSEITEILSYIDYEKIEMNEDNQTIYLEQENMQLDLGAIAKGFIADRINELFEEKEVSTGIIDLGGNIYVRGEHPRQDNWTIGIQNPFEGRGELVGKVTGENISVVTSGIYERYLEVDGKQYHHLLNPIDGYPFDNEIAGVTIISEKSIDGDALSTLVFSKGLEGGLQAIEEMDDIDVIIVTKDKEVYLSEGFTNFELTNEDFVLMEGVE